MGISYKKLWVLLIDRDIKKSSFRKELNLSSGTWTKLNIAITKELTDLLRKNQTIDWQKKESARAGMRRLVKRLLKKHKYPPEGMDDAVQTVMSQCEMWTDNVMTA